MESEQLIAALREQFEAWKDEVLRLAEANSTKYSTESTTERVGGLTHEQILSTFDLELKAHTDQTNPHGLTLATFAGMSSPTFDTLQASYYPRTGFPFTKVVKLPFSVNGATITVPAFDTLFMGMPIKVPAAVLTVTGAVRKYLKVVVTGVPGRWIGTMTLADNANEDTRNIVVGHTALVANVATTVTVAIFRLGYAAVTQTPRGLAIPASKGVASLEQSLEPGWFAT